MTTRFFTSLRARLTLVVLAGVVPALFLILYLGQQERKRAVEEARKDALRLVRLASAQQEQLIARTQQFLSVLARLPQVRGRNDAACSSTLAELESKFPLYAIAGKTDAEGEIVCSSRPLSGPTKVADRAWFQRAKQTRGFAVGEYQVGRITGIPNLVCAYPLAENGDEFRGVVFAALDLKWINNLADESQYPPGSVVTVVDRGGTILVRRPDPGNWVGKSQPDAPVVRSLLAREPEGTVEVEGLDGVRRLYGFAPLRAGTGSEGVVVSVGVPSALAFAEADRMQWRYGAVLATVAFFALLAAWLGGHVFILRHVRELMATAERLRGGDLSARAPVLGAPGELQELAGTVNEMAESLERRIAERERAEDALREREASFHVLFANNPHPMWVYDLETLNFLEVNNAAIKAYGYSRDEFLQMRITDIRPPEDVPFLLQNLARERQDLERSGEWRHRLKDGRIIHAEVTSHRLEFGGRAAALVVAQDVTERKRAERALRLSEERFAKAFHGSPDSISIGTLDEGRLLEVNEAFERLSGYSRREAIGRRSLDLGLWADPADRERVASLLRRDGRVRDREIKLRARSGELRNVLFSAELVELLGEPCVLAVVRDITERQALEDQLRHAQKMDAIGRLAGGVAHDFNNLLMVILGHSELLLEHVGEDQKLRHNAEEVRKAARRAASLTQQLLTFSRKQVLEMRAIQLDALIRETGDMLRRLIGENIELDIEAEPELWPVRADAGQVGQVLVNLAVNARDAMPQGGRLVIEASNVILDAAYARLHHGVAPGPYALVAVSDTGVGMDAETQSRLFEPFFTTKETGKGTGLGLAMVYGIVKQCGGFIWVYSEAGKGTTFKIYLPRAPESGGVAAEDIVEGSLPHGTETILLVEDEAPVRELARECLESHGYTVLEASRGTEALEIASSHAGRIHLLLTDMIMPGMNGRELAQKILAARPDVKVLYVSGYTSNGVLQQDSLDPSTNFLQKPFSPGVLMRRLRAILDSPAGN